MHSCQSYTALCCLWNGLEKVGPKLFAYGHVRFTVIHSPVTSHGLNLVPVSQLAFLVQTSRMQCSTRLMCRQVSELKRLGAIHKKVTHQEVVDHLLNSNLRRAMRMKSPFFACLK